MQLEQVVTLGNAVVRLRVLALERSLRATGCDLPLKVIPYDRRKFDLPGNSSWWEIPELLGWLGERKAHPMMHKYQCLLIGGYQYIDSDAIFLRNPQEALSGVDGFVASCGHWHNPDHTVNGASRRVLGRRTTVWQSNVFNAGQFACDRPIYDLDSLIRRAEGSEDFRQTCIHWPYNDQTGLNLLVLTSGVPITNLTLPPYRMESTWAGDYPTPFFRSYWSAPWRTPYLIHWAGCHEQEMRPIDELFLNFLTKAERKEWEEERRVRRARSRSKVERAREYYRRWRRVWWAFRDEILRRPG